MAKKTKTERILKSVGHELKVNEPKIVKKMRRTQGSAKADQVKTAILLDKARRRGANIPKKRSKK